MCRNSNSPNYWLLSVSCVFALSAFQSLAAADPTPKELLDAVVKAHANNYATFTSVRGTMTRVHRDSTAKKTEVVKSDAPEGATIEVYESPERTVVIQFYMDDSKQRYNIIDPADVAMNVDGKNSADGLTRSLIVANGKHYETVYRSKVAWVRSDKRLASPPPLDPRNTASLDANFTFPEVLTKEQNFDATMITNDAEQLIRIDLKKTEKLLARYECSSKFRFLPTSCTLIRDNGAVLQEWKFGYRFVPEVNAYFPSEIDGKYFGRGSTGKGDWTQWNSTTITDCKFGIPIDPKLFEFDPPEGCRVTDVPAGRIYTVGSRSPK